MSGAPTPPGRLARWGPLGRRCLAYTACVLIVVDLGVAVATRGRRSVHDLVAATVVERVAAAPIRSG